MLNETLQLNLSTVALEIPKQYAPSQECFDWCQIQHVVHSNNIELNAILFIVFAYFCIVGYYIAGEFPKLKRFQETLIYLAKLSLILFLGFYILIIRLRLIW